MPFFGRKKREEKGLPSELPPLSSLDQISPVTMHPMAMQQPQLMQQPMQQPEQMQHRGTQMSMSPLSQPPVEKKVEKMPERQTAAPLFVKIDRYKQILGTISGLKTSLVIVKKSLAMLEQIEKLRATTIDVVTQSINKVDQKIGSLDNELLRPTGYHDPGEGTSEYQDARSLESTISDLQEQIEQLRSDLDRMS